MSAKQSKIFFGSNRNKPNSICFGCFSVCFEKLKNIFFGLFRCFGSVSKRPKQTEFSQNKPKKSSKNVLYSKGSWKPLIFFIGSNQTKPKLNLFRLFFGLLFRETIKKFLVCFGLFRCFGPVSKQPKQTELMVWGMKRLIF